MRVAIAMVPALILAFVLLAIPVLIGVYVYRDAADRGMNAALWTIVAMLTPGLIGLIIYLLVRGGHPDLKCPSCAIQVAEQYVICPKCGAKLRASCPNCRFPVEPDWTACPKCAEALPEHRQDYTSPVQKKDAALNKILLAVILIPMLFIVVAILGLGSFGGGNMSSMSTTSMTVDAYEGHAEVLSWIRRCDDDPSGIYALRYQAENEEEKETCYLIYRPSEYSDSIRTDQSGLFGVNIDVSFYGGHRAGDWDNHEKLIYIAYYANKHAGLKVSVNGKKVDCEVTDVNFKPEMPGLHPFAK